MSKNECDHIWQDIEFEGVKGFLRRCVKCRQRQAKKIVRVRVPFPKISITIKRFKIFSFKKWGIF